MLFYLYLKNIIFNVNITQIIFCAYFRFTGHVLRAGITK